MKLITNVHTLVPQRRTFVSRNSYNPIDRTFKDTGCWIFKECLSCPLPQCIYDKALARQLRLATEYFIGILLKRFGYTIEDIEITCHLENYTVRMAYRNLGIEGVDRFLEKRIEYAKCFTNLDILETLNFQDEPKNVKEVIESYLT